MDRICYIYPHMHAHELFDKHADTYQEKYMDVTAYAGVLAQMCMLLPQDAMVLDAGCGPGNITRFLLTHLPHLRITGIDMAPAMIQLARANCPSATFIEMDCRDISSLADRYDAVILGFCLPYLSNEDMQQLIAGAGNIMVPGAILYLSTMEHTPATVSGVRTSGAGDEVYIHYHPATLIKDHITSAGFSILTEKRQPALNGDSDLIILARKR